MEAAKYGYAGATWPVQYLAGKSQLDRLIERERSMRAAAEGAPPTGELT
jgi:anthraniloyl-CoA monooxygenase